MLDFGTDKIDKLLTLGSPLLPPPEGVIDQTRGILSFLNAKSPGAFHPDVTYINVVGKYLKGAPLLDNNSTIAQRLVGLGYQQVCGDAAVWGDGICPVPTGQLPGAKVL